VATIARLLQLTLGVEQSVFVEADLLLEVLVAEDAAALATVMATHEETEGLLAARGGADNSRTIRLEPYSQLCPIGPEDIVMRRRLGMEMAEAARRQATLHSPKRSVGGLVAGETKG
jgi:hypothetical protein